MVIQLREINKADLNELAVITRNAMEAVLETCPEFEGREELAQKALGNFSFEQMSEMINNDYEDPTKRLMVATIEDAIVGSSIYSVKQDGDGRRYGFCFSRYVDPNYRRQGVAAALLQDQLDWFNSLNVEYIIAHTHITNVALQNLFLKFGFQIEGPFQGHWSYYLLRKDISVSE